MSYIPVECNNYTCVKLKEIIYPIIKFVLESCDNFGLSDLVKFSTCKNKKLLNAILWYTWYTLVVAVSDLIICFCCFQFYQLLAQVGNSRLHPRWPPTIKMVP